MWCLYIFFVSLIDYIESHLWIKSSWINAVLIHNKHLLHLHVLSLVPEQLLLGFRDILKLSSWIPKVWSGERNLNFNNTCGHPAKMHHFWLGRKKNESHMVLQSRVKCLKKTTHLWLYSFRSISWSHHLCYTLHVWQSAVCCRLS